MGGSEQPEVMGIRQLLAEVNLRDFAAMVGTDFGLVCSSVRDAAESRALSPWVFLVALLRLILLGLVAVILGPAILAMMLIRGAVRFGSGALSRHAA